MHSNRVALTSLAFACFALASVLSTQACGSDGGADIFCREQPGECAGEIGGECQSTDDCFDGTCCPDKNCGDGMCTYFCDDDFDCPETMGCEHGFCFFLCERDEDCGPGQSCEHGKTICEYEGGD